MPTMAWLCSLCTTQAALIVYEDVTPNLAWPGSPIAISASDPQVSTTGIGTSGNTLAQTFVAPSNFTLRAVALSYFTTSANTSPTHQITISLFTVADPLAGTIPTTGSPDLLGGGAGLVFTPSVITGGSGANEDVIIFEFTGLDQIALTAGQGYAFQIAGTAGTSFAWGREGSGGSLGGEGYQNGNEFVTDQNRDFKMALYDANPIPEPSAALATILGSGLLLIFRRRRR